MRGELRAGERVLRWGERTYLMGIVNVTPDSFSGDGITDAGKAADLALAQWEAGADLIDVGGESTRPGHTPVSEAEEIARVVPVLERIRARSPAIALSIDTHKPGVLAAAYTAGARVLNSVWGLPESLLRAAAERNMPVIAMHNKERAEYDGDVMDHVLRFLNEAAQRAVAIGIPASNVVLDPGVGFGKTAEHNVRVLAELPRLSALGFPTLLGASRKSTIGKLTGREPQDRVYGTAATTALAVCAGIDMVRVHDVGAARDVVRVCDAAVRGWRPPGWT